MFIYLINSQGKAQRRRKLINGWAIVKGYKNIIALFYFIDYLLFDFCIVHSAIAYFFVYKICAHYTTSGLRPSIPRPAFTTPYF